MAIIRRNREALPAPTPVVDPEPTVLLSIDIEHQRLSAYSDGNRGASPHPKDVPVEILLAGVQYVQNGGNEFGRIEEFYRSRIRSPLTAVRAFCVMCMDGPKKASECQSVTCPLWAFRKGKNSFFGRNREEADDDGE